MFVVLIVISRLPYFKEYLLALLTLLLALLLGVRFLTILLAFAESKCLYLCRAICFATDFPGFLDLTTLVFFFERDLQNR